MSKEKDLFHCFGPDGSIDPWRLNLEEASRIVSSWPKGAKNAKAMDLKERATKLSRHLQWTQKRHDETISDLKKACTHQYADGKSAVFNGWALDECRICGQALNGGDAGWA